ncbi:hypothetical protein RYX36_023769 [Vicia faba]
MKRGNCLTKCHREMMRPIVLWFLGVKPNGTLLASVLKACTMVGAFEEGKWIHSYVEENGLEYELELGTALIDFYTKCGCLKSAEKVFKKWLLKMLLLGVL